MYVTTTECEKQQDALQRKENVLCPYGLYYCFWYKRTLLSGPTTKLGGRLISWTEVDAENVTLEFRGLVMTMSWETLRLT